MLNYIKPFAKKWLLHSQRHGRTSYAQEGEDVLLWRLMDRNHATAAYVDVGCNHAFSMSNTAFFYKRGWSGVAIDPNPAYAADFAKYRRRDTFVNCGIAANEGEMTYYSFEQPLYNTFCPEKASEIDGAHSRIIQKLQIPVRPLRDVLSEIWPDGRELRLLSIDCEGFDLQVLESHNFASYPVEFICIEVDDVAVENSLNSPIASALKNREFIPIAKLCKSLIAVHKEAANRWGILP